MRYQKFYPLLFIVLCCAIPYLVTAPMERGKVKNSSEASEFIVKLYRTETKKTEEIPLREYLCGVVAAEMQADYEPEALKAQAVAACSYTLYRYEYIKNGTASESPHPDAYVCDDFTHCKGYLSAADAKKRWGKDWFERYYPRLEAAVSQVYGQVITYDGEIINAVFHAISSGTTESAENVWGTDIPYLRSVDSAADTTASGYESTVSYTERETADILSGLGVTPTDDPDEWFGAPQLDSAGSVESVSVCGTELSGRNIREAFALRSTAFAITHTDGKFLFTVHGYGHQVGMSQYGANRLAAEGMSYTEILQYYYTGVKIQNYNF